MAFAAHAFMIAQGFKLEAVGDDAEKASSAGVADYTFALTSNHVAARCRFIDVCSFDKV